ncbi:MAG: histidine kinase [Proteocatella sp.]
MDNKELLLEIMEKTTASLEVNKDSVISLISNMQSEYEKKKQELIDIKKQIPVFIDNLNRLTNLDRHIRQKLASASSDFSQDGHENLKLIFEEANKIHFEFLKAGEDEQSLIRQRNNLELDLKKSHFYIEQAEHMAQQIIVSLSYLKTGITHLNLTSEENPVINSNSAAAKYMSFLKSIENEKLHIARDLHDGPAQQIASAQMRVDFCKTIIRHDLEKGLKILDQLKSDLASSLTEVRNILFNLTPAPLEKMGLKGSIENLLNTSLDPEETNITFYYEIDPSKLEPTLQITVYRIIQELINNIKKHAHGTQVMLRLYSSAEYMYIHIMDNGVGFEVPSDFEVLQNNKKSYGLANISTRINDLDGQFHVNSDKNKGTTFKIQLPL